jgi:3-oxoacyl-[acyl-carrier-protein] synthase III
MYNKIIKSDSQHFCHIIGLGHSEPTDSEFFRIVTQEEFIRSLPQDVQEVICKNGATIEEVAKTWGEMISEKRTFFDGDISSLAMFAVNRCFEDLKNRGIDFDPSSIDAVIGATNTGPGYPSLADFVKNGIGVKSEAMCFDVAEACTAGSVAIFQAQSLIRSGACKNVLVTCAEKATTLTNLENWQGSNLFGDASFAVLLTATNDPNLETFDFFEFNSFPYQGNLGLIRKTETGFVQEGKKVHIFVVKDIVESLVNSIKKAGINPVDIDHLVVHQPSNKTVSSLKDYILPKLPEFKGIFHKSEDIGNASSASFGNMLSKHYHEGMIKSGELIVTCTFGAGLSVGIIGLRL